LSLLSVLLISLASVFVPILTLQDYDEATITVLGLSILVTFINMISYYHSGKHGKYKILLTLMIIKVSLLGLISARHKLVKEDANSTEIVTITPDYTYSSSVSLSPTRTPSISLSPSLSETSSVSLSFSEPLPSFSSSTTKSPSLSVTPTNIPLPFNITKNHTVSDYAYMCIKTKHSDVKSPNPYIRCGTKDMSIIWVVLVIWVIVLLTEIPLLIQSTMYSTSKELELVEIHYLLDVLIIVMRVDVANPSPMLTTSTTQTFKYFSTVAGGSGLKDIYLTLAGKLSDNSQEILHHDRHKEYKPMVKFEKVE